VPERYETEEKFQLDRVLAPGESRKYFVVPNPARYGYVPGVDYFFEGDSCDGELWWNGADLSDFSAAEFAVELLFSGEGEILVDVLAKFNDEIKFTFAEGWNLVTVPGDDFMAKLLVGHLEDVIAVYRWGPVALSWESRFPSIPFVANDLGALEPGWAYWIQVKRSFTFRYQP